MAVSTKGNRPMILLNFTHSLTDARLAAIEQLTSQPIARVIDAFAQFDNGRPFTEQAQALIDSIVLTPQEWQTAPLLVNLPGHNAIAALVLAELHGRMGYFPAVLRIRPVTDTTPPQFEIAEILNLQAVRDRARVRRKPQHIGGV
jgi:hypothetical protein